MNEQKYATYTGDQFLFFELKEVLKLKKVKSENLFQYTSVASISRVLPPVRYVLMREQRKYYFL